MTRIKLSYAPPIASANAAMMPPGFAEQAGWSRKGERCEKEHSRASSDGLCDTSSAPPHGVYDALILHPAERLPDYCTGRICEEHGRKHQNWELKPKPKPSNDAVCCHADVALLAKPELLQPRMNVPCQGQ
eukprot:CAMPEP_0170580248 /NCGR_PEP_ID=MMETSP0224-20130122/6410_1 /TAXON_ID=285029 /ORGANISM="Togula jolla, Strain CCCM 725" /LENGTH=130 /DNA_ID=CAMNT_0010903315 /DNA_START=192 /DNA_END=586 /DNA_ORIENTATION=+